LSLNGDYWTGYIMGSCQANPVKLDWARLIMDDTKNVTVADMNKTAAQYLGADKAIDMRIVPKTSEAPASPPKSTK
jgi:hypothetical protein